MNNQQSKYFYTASLFDDALIELLNKKDYEYISIKEICEKAGVNRSTFYLHYESKEDLLNETLDYISTKFDSYFDIEHSDFLENLKIADKKELNIISKPYLKPYLEFIKDNKKIFNATFKNSMSMNSHKKYLKMEKDVFYPLLDKHNIPNNKKKYFLRFYMDGIMGIVKEWILNDCNDDTDYIVELIIECVRP